MVSAEENNWLTSVPSIDEGKATVFDLNGDGAVLPDMMCLEDISFNFIGISLRVMRCAQSKIFSTRGFLFLRFPVLVPLKISV